MRTAKGTACKLSRPPRPSRPQAEQLASRRGRAARPPRPPAGSAACFGNARSEQPAFTSPEADDRTNFERRSAWLRNDSFTTNRVIEIDGRVVGHRASSDLAGHDWGRGIAARALKEFLQLERSEEHTSEL